MAWRVCLLLILGAGVDFYADAQELKCDSAQPQCCDQNRFCTFWSSRGECNRNPSWMLVNCKMSCNSCSRPAMPVVPPPLFPTPTVAPPVVSQSPKPQPTPARDPSAPAGCAAVQPSEIFFAPSMSNGQFSQGTSRTGCGTANQPRDCARNMCFHQKFRSMDGVCNNLGRPLSGAAFTPNPRFLPSAYDDGVNALVGSTTGSRPNPRQVSVSLLATTQAVPLNASSLLMQWGQFLAHDVTQNALGGACNCGTRSPNCANMPAVANDPLRLQCSMFARSIAECGTGFQGRPRQQMNLNTAYIDASAVYGSDSSVARQLRSGFLLRFAVYCHLRVPIGFQGDFRRQMIPSNGATVFGGDARSGIFAGLHALQTYFLRLHNKLANQLASMNPRWNQDRVYEETRKIVGAIIQVITYKEFLPTFFGSTNRIGSYGGYDSNVDSSILNEFAGAAFRLHGLLESSYTLRDPNHRPVSTMTFGQGISPGSSNLVASSMDFIIRGLIATPARSPQRLSNAVADSFFNLATASLQRGRDHGFQPYNAYRRQCGLGSLSSFDNWPDVSDPAVIARVKQLYPGGVDTLDLYVGGLLERPQGGAVVGPTFSCIITEQFKRLRDGDRFYFENPGTFTQDQLIALRRVTISWVICSNSDSVSAITRTGFFTDSGSTAVPCNTLQGLDLTAWRE